MNVSAVFDTEFRNISNGLGDSKLRIGEISHSEKILLCIDDTAKGGVEKSQNVYSKLLSFGIDEDRILLQSCPKDWEQNSWNIFAREFAEIIYENSEEGNVAEAGVFRGMSSAKLNEYFHDRKLYLFDTFAGYDSRDSEQETNFQPIAEHHIAELNIEESSEFIVKLRCPKRENVVVRKGWVPETLKGLEDEKFVFVFLDMNLYAPTIAALRFFAPRLSKQGIIILHDYYLELFPGIKRAVNDFSKEFSFRKFPLGDGMSIGLMFY
jgi:predicted O-methyltransferase YrrM